VSLQLMTRRSFVPATSVNVLAATWIQFMVKDWFSHGKGDMSQPYEPSLAAGDPWPQQGRPLVIPVTRPDPQNPRTFVNQNSPWWDGSSIYGDSAAQQQVIRAGGGKGAKLNVSPTGLLVLPDDPKVDPSQVPGFWVGLAMMGSLFSAEHNAVVDALARAYPDWDEEELFQRARLVVTALIAKIHTVQWTPAIIAPPTTVAALRANWYGLAGQRIRETFGRLSKSEVVSGILGSETDHVGVPYSLTEEFSIVYRMHPLIPDDYALRRWSNDAPIATHTLRELSGPPRARRCSAGTRWPTCCTPSARPPRGPSSCTTSPGSCRSSSGPTAGTPTSPPPTSSVPGSSASPGTTSSAGCCTSSRPGPSPT